MSELEQTIEELEAEVLAELEEESAADAPKKNAAAAEKQGKVKEKTPGGEVQDGGAPVVDPEAKSSPTDVAAKDADEVSGDAQQKNEKPAGRCCCLRVRVGFVIFFGIIGRIASPGKLLLFRPEIFHAACMED